MGELFFTIIKEQFEALRDGDRFWYERILSKAELREVEDTRLSDIIRRNTEIDDEIPDDVFRARRIRGRGGRRGSPATATAPAITGARARGRRHAASTRRRCR